MIWHRPTSWSCENETGEWYIERLSTGRKWTLIKWRGKGHGIIGVFRSLSAAKAHVEALQ